jgi:hypothetical protein
MPQTTVAFTTRDGEPVVFRCAARPRSPRTLGELQKRTQGLPMALRLNARQKWLDAHQAASPPKRKRKSRRRSSSRRR